jgi:uncharacterized protein (DUF779 family)
LLKGSGACTINGVGSTYLEDLMSVAEVTRVDVTAEAAELLRKLTKLHGPLMFHQSGGCCDGSSPMCYPAGEFKVGGQDILMEVLNIDGIEQPINFWISAAQFEYWKHTHLTVDVVQGRGSGFSVEAPEGKRFLIRSRLFSDEEWQILKSVELTRGG